ncbi:MAG: sporulation protein YqfD [Bacilli bacterium]|nr:sporulation protein YqfD [Bacilli bacterium]
MISYDIYLFHYYSFSALINRCNILNISVKKYYIYNNDFYLKIPRKYRKKVSENFNDFKIVSKIGVINFFELLINKPITLISLFLSIFLFINLASRVYKIELNGDYPYIESYVKEELKNEGINIYGYNIKEENINVIENKLKEKFNDELESLEIYKRGAKIVVNYKKRRKINDLTYNKGSLYATKDGVIKSFDISKGNKQVKINDFVRKGDLLVSDMITNNNEENINIGTRGSVFALTYYFVEVSLSNPLNEEIENYVSLLDMARKEVYRNINSDAEYIEKESILVQDLKSGYMKVYYVLYEDITI